MRRVRVVLKYLHLFIVLITIIVFVATSVQAIIYHTFEKVNIIVNDITYNNSTDSFLYPYVIHYESVDGLYNGEFKSLYKYQWDENSYKTNKNSCIAEVRHDINDIVDDSSIALGYMLTLILVAIYVVIAIARLATSVFTRRLIKKE